MKKFLLSIAVLFTVVQCSAPKETSTIVVGTNAEFPPFEYLEGDQVVGFDIDLIKAVAKKINKEVKIENLTWDGLLPALQSKKVDLIIAGMSVTPDREKVVDFSEPYFFSPEQLILIKGLNHSIKSMDDLTNKKVGVVLGFTGDVIVSSMDNVDEPQRFNSASQAIMALNEGKIDAVMLDQIPAKKYLEQNPSLVSIAGNNTEEAYAIALRKNDALLGQINEALKSLRADGTYMKIYTKYFPEN